MSQRTWWVSTLALLLLASACASQGGPGAGGTKVVTLHMADAGRSITLQMGDRLSLQLGSEPDRHWVMTEVPRTVLSGPIEVTRGRFTLRAMAPGEGRVSVINTFACPPATVHGCSVPEPGGAHGGSVAPSSVPSVFTLTVHVVKQVEPT
jgi:hypothetical protein